MADPVSFDNRKILVTSALPYVNNVPHLGNLVCIISADVYTRYLRVKKVRVLSVLGTDEHGTTTEAKALEEGLTPREVCDKYYAIHKGIYEWFNTQFDCFGRTSSKDNHEVSTDIFLKLNQNGFIIQKESEQFFDTVKGKFLADRFVEGTCPHCGYAEARGDQCDKCGKLLEPTQLINPKSKLSGTTPIKKVSLHCYIDLPKLEPLLRSWISSREAKWSDNSRQITHAWLDANLEPRAITRDLQWGVPVPLKGFENKVLYSWFDAPIGYISIVKENRPSDWKTWWHDDKNVRLVQFMGKDNTSFHTILFPAFLLGAKDNYTLLDSLSVNEFLNYADGKFSKSRNTGVFGDAAIKTGIPADAYRYYLMAIRPEREDTVFDWLDFEQKINKELIANYCNLVNRVISFTNQFYAGKVPKLVTNDLDITADVNEVDNLYNDISLKAATKHIMVISKKLNAYFQEKQPWKVAKEDLAAAGNTLAVLLNRINDLTIMLSPIVPKLAEAAFAQLNSNARSWEDIGKLTITQGHQLAKEQPLLAKLDEKHIKQLKEQFGEKKAAKPASSGSTAPNSTNVNASTPAKKSEKPAVPPAPALAPGQFLLNLRVAQIIKAQPHPQADKLYVIQLDTGNGTSRQIVSGLREYLTAEQLVGKKIVLVANLKPAKLRGVESNGMLLAGMDDAHKLALLEAHASQPGDAVYPQGMTPGQAEIMYDHFSQLSITVKDKKVFVDGKQLVSDTETIGCDLDSGKVS